MIHNGVDGVSGVAGCIYYIQKFVQFAMNPALLTKVMVMTTKLTKIDTVYSA